MWSFSANICFANNGVDLLIQQEQLAVIDELG